MTRPRRQLRIPGRALLREVVEAYQPYREAINERDTGVLIVRFTPPIGAPEAWRSRTEASAISAEQKVRVFTALGAQVNSIALPDTVAPGEFLDRIQAANDDPASPRSSCRPRPHRGCVTTSTVSTRPRTSTPSA